MVLFSLFFLMGILILQLWTRWPGNEVWVIVGIMVAFLFLFKKNQRYFKYVIPFLLGFVYAGRYASNQLQWTLPPGYEGKPLEIVGIIDSLPHSKPQQTSFKFFIKKIQFENKIEPVHAIVQLSWKTSAQNLQVGDEWCFTVYLKKIKGLMNPGSFNFETQSFQEGVRATGNIVTTHTQFRNSHWYHHPLDRVRQHMKNLIQENLPKSSTSSWITALAIGEREGISQEAWEVLKNTGTNHLIAIAGLHIGLMSALIFSVITWLWRRLPRFMLILPAPHAGAIAALILALVYSAMAGFSIPTQRACIMLSLFLLTFLFRRKILAWQFFSLALFFVLFFNPLCVLTASFWLSFTTIAFIIYGVRGRLAPVGFWWKHGRTQWVITLGLIPLGIGFFQQCSWISFIANSIAIPCMGFLVLPLTLLGCFFVLFSEKAGCSLFFLADKILSVLWILLTYLSHLSWSTWYQVIPGTAFILCAFAGMIILLLPLGFPGRWLGVIGLLPLLLYKPAVPAIGDVWLTVLDVGQGLSIVIQTHRHLLVFDTGARMSERSDMGENVVVPFLHTLAATHIDRLVISHGDNDHIGGSAAVLKQFPTYLVQSSVPQQFINVPASLCLRGEKWEWDQVKFEFLYPTIDRLGLNNDSSCVLRVTSGIHHVLLTGDIEKIAENDLTQYLADELSADILVAPHHGSATSAVDAFINDVHPRIVLISTGYRNHYHFPNPKVVQKYHEMGAETFNTAETGAIHLEISKQISAPSLYRVNHHHYWSS